MRRFAVLLDYLIILTAVAALILNAITTASLPGADLGR